MPSFPLPFSFAPSLMPLKSRSSTSKATTSKRASLGFSSSKKGTSASSSKPLKKSPSESPAPVAPSKQGPSLAGLYPRLYKEALRQMGPPVHREEMDDIEIVLRVFDAKEEYGPSSRISRLERFERAQKLGLNPDPEIGEILRSTEGQENPVYANSVFNI
ncbi:hypothetical protein JCM8547_002027 [Rhodosporidiobolus lusitaniae]